MASSTFKSSSSKKLSSKSSSLAPQDDSQPDKKQKLNWKKSKHFLHEIELCNSLPDPGTGPIYLNIPTISSERMGSWCSSSLDQKYVWSMNPSNRLSGVSVEMIDPSEYLILGSDQCFIHPDDYTMLNWRDNRGKKTSRGQQPDEPWLLKSKIDSHRMYRSGEVVNDDAGDQGQNSQSQDSVDGAITDEERLIETIKSSFDSIQRSPSADVDWSIEILPDAELWVEDLVEVALDVDLQFESSVAKSFLSLSSNKPGSNHYHGSVFSSSSSSSGLYSKTADYRLDGHADSLTSTSSSSFYMFRLCNHEGNMTCYYSNIKKKMDLRILPVASSELVEIEIERRELSGKEIEYHKGKLKMIGGLFQDEKSDLEEEETRKKRKRIRIEEAEDEEEEEQEDDDIFGDEKQQES